MPHEVIMPALGMAQDSGLIVAWHKSAGDAVASGDLLFEVETDKATMQVEAQADGILGQIRVQAGDEVPVGNVIAVIGDGTEEATPGVAPTTTGDDLPEGAKVIMPALGMAQDTGVIVAWHKGLGDAVTASDLLFEVETDKATMEVEAGHDGFVAALLAKPGEEVPVGDSIAIIAARKPGAPVQIGRAGQGGAAGPAAPRQARPAPMSTRETRPSPKAPQPAAGVRILASPKARRLALEQGLDLTRLAKAGIPQPYHVADLKTLKALPAETAAAPVSAAQHIAARVPAEEFEAFAARVLSEKVAGSAILAAFAAAALRGAGTEGTIVVRVTSPVFGQSASYADPDLTALGSAQTTDDQPPDLVLRDLTASCITGLTLGTAEAPALNMARDGTDFVLALDFTAGQLTADAAIQTIDGMAARLGEPLRHLL